MQHVKIINSIFFILILCFTSFASEIEGIDIEKDNRVVGTVYTYDIDKNGKADTIKKIYSNVLNIDGENIDYTKISDFSLYENNKSIYQDITYEIELDNQKKVSFLLREKKVVFNGTLPAYSDNPLKLPKKRGFILGIDSDRQLTWDIYFGFNKHNDLVVTKIVTMSRWDGECTNYFKKPMLPKVIDIFEIENMKLKNCKKNMQH